MAEQTVTLQPDESQQVSFEATPHEAKTYQVLVDGLTGSFVAIEAPPPELIYASDVRRETKAGTLYFEVDVGNIGGAPGSCTPIAFIRTSGRDANVNMGTKEIKPGEVITFYGNWRIGSGLEWWDAIHIASEAGLISFIFGRSLQFISYDMPAEIVSGSEFTAKMTLLLPYRSRFAYDCHLRIYNPVAGAGIRVIKVRIGSPDFTYNPLDLIMYSSGTYELTGIAIAEYRRRISQPKEPLPPGTYDVTTRVIGCDNAGWPYFVFYDCPVGQVEVI